MKKLCVITGTRAEYGLLSGVMRLIRDSKTAELQLIVTNMHLSKEHGNTYQEIENDGFIIHKKVYMNASSDSPHAIVHSMGQALSGFADAFTDLQPDIIIVLGDRYEMLAAVSAALLFSIPIAHIHGGEITEGAIDDSIRHAITKMSNLHFTATELYRKRVIQLGEHPDTVFYVGSLGVENSKKTTLLSKQELEKMLSFELTPQTIVVTYHPVTREPLSAHQQIQALLDALEKLKTVRIIFTFPNSDAEHSSIRDAIILFAKKHAHRSLVVQSLGMIRYLSTLQYIGAVVGNSSSGIIEAPSFGIPTVNIGSRQKGRIGATSIMHCDTNTESIYTAIQNALSPEYKSLAKQTVNPYDKENTAQAIFSTITTAMQNLHNSKSFYTI